MTFHIGSVPNEAISQLWGVIGPFLIAGSRVEIDTDLETEIANVMAGRARVWMITEDDRCVAAFVTRVICDSDGRALDIYGLGGVGQLRWGRYLNQVMHDYAKAAECERMICKGRKALLRTYRGFRIVGEDGAGHYIFERAVT